MEKSAGLQKRDCWICFHKENNITLTKLNYGKMLKHCKTYLDTSIINKLLGNENPVSCCNYCYETARQLTTLEKQVKKLQKEILDLSSVFSKTVLQRRSLAGSDKDSAKELTPQMKGNCFNVQKHPDCKIVLENAITKNEVIVVNDTLPNELPSDPQKREAENDDLVTDSWFDTSDNGSDNATEGECENFVGSNDEVDVKYSFDETFSKDINKETVPNPKSMSLADLLKSVKMPIIRLERLMPERSRNSKKIVDGDGEETTIKLQKEIVEYKCSTCEKCFTNNLDLQDHKKLHNKDRPYTCTFCDKSFRRSSDRKIHLRIHTGETPYLCSVCPKSFIRASMLKDHEIVHSGEKHKCSFCSKSFKTANNLREHKKIHSGKKPHKCPFCEKSFLRPFMLKEHVRAHTEDRPFKCSFCSKSFRRYNTLKEHEMIHTGGRPHQCSLCKKSFKRLTHLKHHERIHSGKLYKCSICEKAYTQSCNLKLHFNLKHKNEEKYEEFILS